MFQPKLHIFIHILSNSERIASKPSQSGVSFLIWLKEGITTLCLNKNCTISSICWSILNRLVRNLHKVGLITVHFDLDHILMNQLQTFTMWGLIVWLSQYFCCLTVTIFWVTWLLLTDISYQVWIHN